MFMDSLILAISSSIDSLGIGITYGIKSTKISITAKIILFIIAFIVSIFSIWFGNFLKLILPDFIALYIGSLILIFMGLFICLQCLRPNKKEINSENNNCISLDNEEKVYSFFIKFLGITIKIIKNPVSSDFDNSNSIDSKEALFLGLALSLDSFCIGIGFSIMNISSFLFPFLISCFQLFFLNIGNFIGRKLHNSSNLPDNVWSIISGILLVIIGVLKILL